MAYVYAQKHTFRFMETINCYVQSIISNLASKNL